MSGDVLSICMNLMKKPRAAVPLLLAGSALLCVGIPALAATPKVGKWSGTTSFTYSQLGIPTVAPVDTRFSTVRARGGARRVKRFTLGRLKLIDCTPRQAGPYGGGGFVSHATPKVRNGHFHITETTRSGASRYTLKVRGRFTSRGRSKGTLTYMVVKPGVTCTTGGEMHWSATLGGHPPSTTK